MNDNKGPDVAPSLHEATHTGRPLDVALIYKISIRAVYLGLKSSLGNGDRLMAGQIAAMAGVKLDADFVKSATRLPLESQGLLLWNLNKAIDNPALRSFIADTIASRMAHAQPGRSPLGAEFASNGFVALSDVVNHDEARSMAEYFAQCSDTSRDGTLTNFSTRDVVLAPHAFRVATDPRILDVARHHLGCDPLILQMDAWRSELGDAPMGPQIFHRDRDDFRACKLFVYLSDVDESSGPHIFIRGSHRLDAVSRALESRGRSLEPMQLFGKTGREYASELQSIFGPSVLEITGPAGTCFLENTYGFHRGKVPTTGARCVLQVLYGMIPYPGRLQRRRAANLSSYPPGASVAPIARNALRFLLGA